MTAREGEAAASPHAHTHAVLDGLLVAPRCAPPLDPGFRPMALARAAFAEMVRATGAGVTATLGVERPGGVTEARSIEVLPDGHPGAAAGHALAERLAKALLWSRGGFRVWVDGPPGLVDALRRHYNATEAGRFDADVMGRAVHGRPCEVVAAPRAAFPSAIETPSALGGHLDGCRIGFDLGASDRKVAAVMDGRVVFSEEVAWNPSTHADPAWHRAEIDDSLRRAASYLPRVDAIGGSSAGIYVDSEVRVASLFRSVPPDVFATGVTGLFRDLREAWGGIPFVVLNDGDVTALAGAMLGGLGGLLGIAMGSSEAAGYVATDGTLTRWLNELAFVPIDAAPGAPLDEWSHDRGCGAQYLSQQAVVRLLPAAGIPVDAGTPAPEQLVLLQGRMDAGDERAARVYETIGTYLGYALLEYTGLYAFDHVLTLGRVTTGAGGSVIVDRAREVLAAEDPAIAARLVFHEVSERDKRHGQAVAAASLPAIESPRS